MQRHCCRLLQPDAGKSHTRVSNAQEALATLAPDAPGLHKTGKSGLMMAVQHMQAMAMQHSSLGKDR